MSFLRRGHANLFCIVPILTDDPRRESKQDLQAGEKNGRERGGAGGDAVIVHSEKVLVCLDACFPALAGLQTKKIVYTSRFVRVILAQGPC